MTDRPTRNAELMRLAEAAVTPYSSRRSGTCGEPVYKISPQYTDRGAMRGEDAAYIVAACNAVPDLVRENEEMAEEIERLRQKYGDGVEGIDHLLPVLEEP